MDGWEVWQHRQDDTPISFTVEENISIKSSLLYRCKWHVQSTWKVWQHQTGEDQANTDKRTDGTVQAQRRDDHTDTDKRVDNQPTVTQQEQVQNPDKQWIPPTQHSSLSCITRWRMLTMSLYVNFSWVVIYIYILLEVIYVWFSVKYTWFIVNVVLLLDKHICLK